MFCPKCGSPNEDNAYKCVQCGSVVQAVPPPIVSVRQSNAPIVVIVIVVGAFFMISIIGILAAIAVPQFMSYRIKAYDAKAYAVLQNACATANSVLTKNPAEHVTLDLLMREGLNAPSDVEIIIENDSVQDFLMTACHKRGKKTYFTGLDCSVREEDSVIK